jgi:hypothetical protein
MLWSVLSRPGALAVLAELHALSRTAHLYQSDRDSAKPNLFRVRLAKTDRGQLHGFDFGVDDQSDPGRLFVVEAVHTPLGPFP